jgi:4-alpha-glucanotransferase
MNLYYDAFRIDHILGFFRIWSVPYSAVEAILGRFVPAIPIDIAEFNQGNIYFDHDRYCKPFITDELLNQLFHENAEAVKSKYLESSDSGTYNLKEDFNTQRKVEVKLSSRVDSSVKQGLFDLLANVILLEDQDSPGQHFHFTISMEKTYSFLKLDSHTQSQLKALYSDYFYHRQNEFWKIKGMEKLSPLKLSTEMLIFGEDLGMVPECVPVVMKQLGILSLEVERMPKSMSIDFTHPNRAPYLSDVTPSTHDMSTIRGWWEEDRRKTQEFYNKILGHYGLAPYYCEPWISTEIIIQHLYSPAMWAIFLWQDLLGMDGRLRRENPDDERINVPADPNHYWGYRMHMDLEDLLKEREFNLKLKQMIHESGRDTK